MRLVWAGTDHFPYIISKAELGAQRPGRVGNNDLKELQHFSLIDGYNDAAYEAINVDSIPRDQVAALPVLLLSTHGNDSFFQRPNHFAIQRNATQKLCVRP